MAKELLKEAIADAKAVREVALQNAKMALEEAFDSKIKNMLSAKLAEEIEEDDLDEAYMEDEKEEKSEAMSYDEDDKDMDEAYHEDDKDMDEAYMEDDKDMDEEINLDELMAELDEEMSYDEDDKVKEVKDEDEVKEAKDEDEANESFDIDALVAEIESSLDEDKDEDTVDEGATGYDEKVGGKGRTGFDDKVGGKGRTGYDGAVKKLKEERDEAMKTVASLQGTLSEMNLLNSKLLYCNKLFRANALTEAQKVKVVDALDMANTANEAKLVFSTLQESFNFTGVEKRAIKEGFGRASKASGNAPKKVITESVDETVSRFQKLANIKF